MKKVATAASFLALTISIATVARGQNTVTGNQSKPPSVAAVDASAVQDNGEIVVTATRREQSLQRVPIAVSALSASTLSNARISSSGGLDQLVPNLTSVAAVGATVYYLRGIGQLSTNPGQEPSVATYVDGVYQPTVFGSLTSLANVQRVEVIKGPQGTLFGRNATGGLINITTKTPSSTPELDLLADYGNFDTVRLSGFGTTGIVDGVATNLSVYYNRQNHGFGRNVTTGDDLAGQKNLDIRSKTLIQPTESTKITLSGTYTKNSSDGNALAVVPGSTAVDGSGSLRNFYDIKGDNDPLDKNRTWQVSGKVEQELGFADFSLISAYTDTKDHDVYDLDATPFRAIDVELSQTDKVFTQEAQLASKKGSRLTWIVGAFYYHSVGRGTPTGVQLTGLAFAPLGGEQSKANLKTNSYAVYGEGTYEILPKLELTIGGRYTIDKKSLSGETNFLDGTGSVSASVPVGSTSTTFKQPTYRAIASYHLTGNVMGYASYSRGFKSGGYDTGFPTGVAFRPEILDAYEVGLKSELFDHRLRLNIAGFYYDYRNLQLPILVIDPNTHTSSQITVNAANSTIKGIDLDGSLRVVRGFNINFGFGYLDSRFKNFPNAPCTSRDALGVTEQFSCDVSGKTLPQAPKTTFNIGGSYELATSLGKFDVSTSYSRKSRFSYDVSDRLIQKGYGLLNGQINLTPTGLPITVGVFAENLTNAKYTVSQFGQAGLGDSYVAGTPRLYGVELRAKF